MPVRVAKRPSPLLSGNDLALIGALLFLGLAVAGIFWYGAARRNADPAASAGERLYNQYCAACHGVDGAGFAVSNAPPLNASGAAWRIADGRLQQLILTGGETMPPSQAFLTPGEAAQIIRYIQTWWTAEQLAQQQAASAVDPLQP